VAHVQRKLFRGLTTVTSGNRLEVQRDGEVLLTASADGKALVPAAAGRLVALLPDNPELGSSEGGHRISGVNNAVRDAVAMAHELCARGNGDSEEMLLEIRSNWLEGGACVELQSIKAGYADIPRDVLKGISLTFEKQSKVAIAGTTGCGKSSLLLVLLRVLETRSGRVLINGVDTEEVGLATLRGALGLVPQDPVLFSGTLRENLDPFGDYTSGRLRKALEAVQLSDMLQSLPSGLEHQIKDEGSNLSYGQRQLVCLARMVLRRPSLLLLDEATSAIDPSTQDLVQNTLDTTFKDSTVVAVAHRLETVLKFDYAAVLDRGDVVEEGPVVELKERKGGVLRKMLETKGVW